MSPFILVTPVSDDKQFDLPKTLAINAMHVVSIKPVIGSRPAIGEIGSLIETLHGSYRVHEVIADFMKIGA